MSQARSAPHPRRPGDDGGDRPERQLRRRAARQLGKVPSALTYSVRQLEDALDVLLFDRALAPGHAHRRRRRSCSTKAGACSSEIDAVANRVKRVATGWETQLTIAVDGVISRTTLLELCESFYACSARWPSDSRGAPRSDADAGAAGDPPAAAHRGAGRHLGGPDHRPGRSGDRRAAPTASCRPA